MGKYYDIAERMINNYDESPFVTKDVFIKHLQNKFEEIEVKAKREGYKEMENIFTDYCKRNDIEIK